MFIIAHYRARPPDSHSTPDSTLIYLATIVLLHDIETNPGPMPPGSMLLSDDPIPEMSSLHNLSSPTVFPCGASGCGVHVDFADLALQCDGCDVWYHIGCQFVNSQTYDDLNKNESVPWLCIKCNMPNRTPSFLRHPTLDLMSENEDSSGISTSEFASPGPPSHSSTPKKHHGHKKRNPLDDHAKVLYFNARSVNNKHGLLQNSVDSISPVLVAVSETFLKKEQADGEIGQINRFSKEYKIHRHDRDLENGKKEGGGGVFIAVRKNFADSYRLEKYENESETVWVKIDIPRRSPQYACCFYRSNTNDVQSLDKFKQAVAKFFSEVPNAQLWIFGDFNLPGIDWSENDHPRVTPHCSQINSHRDFLEFLNEQGLNQMVTTPTREDGVLDLFMTNNDSLVSHVKTIPGISDHNAVLAEMQIRCGAATQTPRKVPLWNKTDVYLDKIRDRIEWEWWKVKLREDIFNDCEKLWTWFQKTMNEAIDEFVPHRQTTRRDRQPWISRETKRMMDKEKRMFANRKKGMKRHPKSSQLKDLQREIQKRLRQEYWKYVENIMTPSEVIPEDMSRQLHSSKTNESSAAPKPPGGEPSNPSPDDKKKKLYQHLKHAKQDSIGVAPIRNTTTGELETEPRKKAQLLNNQFFSVFSAVSPVSLIKSCSRLLGIGQTTPVMPEFTISENGVLKLLGTLKPNKAAGPDKLRPHLLRDLRQTVSPILTRIFTLSYDNACCPEDWKTANVVPAFKKGSKNKAENYRPISLTCICSKMMEHIMVSQINRHNKAHNTLVNYQHGFRNKLSCDTQLTKFVEDLHVGTTTQGKTVDVIAMDFAKAFDKVSHLLLLHKLHGFGIQGKNNDWIKCWLIGRTQQVVLDGVFSEPCPVSSGVPQGSVLGPTLFLMYINDIGDGIRSHIRLFADDTIIYRSINSIADAQILQEDLNRLYRWSQEWLMEFHPGKCKFLKVNRARTPIPTSYILNGVLLEQVESLKYLGVTFAQNLKWDKHVSQIRGSAFSALNFLRRNLRISSIPVKTTAYLTYVRPRVEYAVCAWDPHTGNGSKGTGLIGKVEMVQRQAARWVLGRDKEQHRKDSVTAMLQKLEWRTLEQRRADIRLTMLFKIHNNLVDINSDQLVPGQGILGSAHPHRYMPVSKQNADQYNAFFPRTIPQWNRLDAGVVDCKSPQTFRSRVSRLQHRC